MRILLLRLLVSWWAIPIIWIVGFPMTYLVNGDIKENIDFYSDLTNELFNGRNEL